MVLTLLIGVGVLIAAITAVVLVVIVMYQVGRIGYVLQMAGYTALMTGMVVLLVFMVGSLATNHSLTSLASWTVLVCAAGAASWLIGTVCEYVYHVLGG